MRTFIQQQVAQAFGDGVDALERGLWRK